MRKLKNEFDRQKCVATVNLTEQEYTLLSRRAENSGMSTGEYMRKLLKERFMSGAQEIDNFYVAPGEEDENDDDFLF